MKKRIKRLLFRLWYYPAVYCLKFLVLLSPRSYKYLIYQIIKMGGVNFVGRPNFISSDVYLDDFDLITIGADCVISKDVIFLTHDYSPTTGLKAIGKRPKCDVQSKGKIVIGDNVFIGLRATILPGTTIGNNVIVGAASVVKGTIPNNSVVIGNPAKVICSIDNYAMRKAEQLNIM